MSLDETEPFVMVLAVNPLAVKVPVIIDDTVFVVSDVNVIFGG